MHSHAFAIKFSTGQIDRAAGVIRGVAVITEGIANGLVVDATTLAQIKTCSETYANGLKVVDRHTKGTDSVFATVGALRNFRIEGPKLLADLYPLKSEANTDKLFEMAESIPDTFGLSVAFSGPNEVRDGQPYARCAEIYNCALVDTPAAQRGLFADTAAAAAQVMAVDAGAKAMATETDFEPRLAKIEAAIAEMSKKLSADKPAATAEEMAAVQKSVTELSAKLADREAFAQSIAKEFSKHVGTSAPVAPAPAAATPPAEPAPADKFEELAKKHFTATKNKVEAWKLAIGEDPTGYKAFLATGKNIKWA